MDLVTILLIKTKDFNTVLFMFYVNVKKDPSFPTCPASGARCPVPAVRCPPSGVRCPLSGVRCPASAVRCPASAVRCPLSAVRCPVSAVRCPLSAVRCPLSVFSNKPINLTPSAKQLHCTIVNHRYHTEAFLWSSAVPEN